MEWSIVFKKVKPSKVLEKYVSEKVTRECQKFSLKVIQATVVLSQSGRDYKAACTVIGANSLRIHVEGKGVETHAAIDNMIHKLDLSLKKSKDKKTEHNHESKEILAGMEQKSPEGQDMEWDEVPVDAEDLLTYEEKKKNKKSA